MHSEPRQRLAAAVRTGRLAHAYLFVGPEGVGKKDVAVELAKALLCEGNPTHDQACDACVSCRLVDAGTHPDLVVTGKPADKLEFPIDQVQQVVAELALKPARGPRRITIVEDADYFNTESANCFLKTLEEPPPGSMLILIGTEAAFQLPTIRSRCQVIPFQTVPDAIIEERLKQDGIVDPTQIEAIVNVAAGSPSFALAAADPAVWPVRQQTLEALAEAKPVGPALAKVWQASIDAAGKESALQRARALTLVRLTLDIFRRALDISLGRPSRIANEGDQKLLTRISEKLGTDDLIDRIERLIDAEAHIDRRVQSVLAVEAAIDAITINATPRLRNDAT